MSEENNIATGEQATDINNGEQVSPQDGQTSKGEDGQTSDDIQKGNDKEAVRKAELEKVPDWVKAEWQKENQSNFDSNYEARRDKETYDDNLPKIVKENNLSAEEQKAIVDQVESLRKYKDETGKTMPYNEALHLATKDLSSPTLKQAVKIVGGALPPSSEGVANTFNTTSLNKFDAMSPAQQKTYMEKSKAMHGGVKFN